MPIGNKGDLFDRECGACGNHGMKKTQAPGRDGPRMVYKCPECGAIDPADDPPSGTYVDKR